MANLNLNKVILGGRLTADVELKTTPSGVSTCSFSLAVNRKYSKEGQQAETDFIECQAWRQTAEFISRYFKKGSSLCVVGSIQKRMWKDQQGNNRYATEVIVDEAMFVDSKNDTQGTFTAPDAQFNAPSYDAPQTSNFVPLNTDDDLPF
jgi:single-strand DNA-binding protein